jgi:hypothetical protein
MSTYWNIECRRCGLEAFDNAYDWSNRLSSEFIEICVSGLLDTKPAAGRVSNIALWGVQIVSDMGYGTIDLHEVHAVDCDHDFEPRNEYGDWATPDMWPDWHPKSRVIVAGAGVECEGLGESRCIG